MRESTDILVRTHTRRQGDAEERAAHGGDVSRELLSAFTAVLTEGGADGAFVAAAVTLPSAAELQAEIKDADPLLLHWVRYWGHPLPTLAMCASSTSHHPPPAQLSCSCAQCAEGWTGRWQGVDVNPRHVLVMRQECAAQGSACSATVQVLSCWAAWQDPGSSHQLWQLSSSRGCQTEGLSRL